MDAPKSGMNEYKVQLETREDLTFLREEMNNFISEINESIPEAIKQQVKSRFNNNIIT